MTFVIDNNPDIAAASGHGEAPNSAVACPTDGETHWLPHGASASQGPYSAQLSSCEGLPLRLELLETIWLDEQESTAVGKDISW